MFLVGFLDLQKSTPAGRELTAASSNSTEFVEAKIEEFLFSFGERLSALSQDAFKTQVTALVKLKECEDAHLGEEVERNWFEVVTQQYIFDRLNKEVKETKTSFSSPTVTLTLTL